MYISAFSELFVQQCTRKQSISIGRWLSAHKNKDAIKNSLIHRHCRTFFSSTDPGTNHINGSRRKADSSIVGDDVKNMLEEEAVYAMIQNHNGNRKGFLQELLPVEHMRDALICVHDMSGLSWTSTITAFTLILKVCFVPIWAMGERARRKNAHLVPVAFELQERLNAAKKTGDVKTAMDIQRKLFMQMARKSFLQGAALQLLATGTQGMTFAWVYGGLKMFAIEPTYCPSFVLEKSLWLPSLALPDPYYVMPSTLWVLMSLAYELNRITTEQMRQSSGAVSKAIEEQEIRQKKMKYFTRISIGIFAYLSCSMTSGTFFYLIPSFMFQAVLRYLTRDGLVAKLLKLPTPVTQPGQVTKAVTFQRVRK